MLVYRHLLTKCLHGKATVLQQITFKKQRNLFVQGYNHTYLEVYAVMEQAHYILIVSHVQASVLCDVINRSRNSLSTPFESFSPCLKEQERIMKDKRNHHSAVDNP